MKTLIALLLFSVVSVFGALQPTVGSTEVVKANGGIVTNITSFGSVQMATNGGPVGPYIEWNNSAAGYDWIWGADVATGEFYLRDNNGPTDLIEFTLAGRVGFPTMPGYGGFMGVDATGQLVRTNAGITLALQSGTALDWADIVHEKRLFREVTTDTTFTFANLPTSATQSVTLVLYLTNNGPAGVASVTFPASVTWPQFSGAPTILQLSNSMTKYVFDHVGGGKVLGYDLSRFTVLAAGAGTTLSSVANTTTVSVATGNFIASTQGNGYNTTFSSTGNISGVVSIPLTITNGPGNTNLLALIKGTNGTSTVLAVAANGNVGIGTASPGMELAISNTAPSIGLFNPTTGGNPASQGAFWLLSSASTFFGNRSGALKIFADNAEIITATGGKVGIGTITPGEKLTALGNVSLSGTNFSTNGFACFDTNSPITFATSGYTNRTGRNISISLLGTALTVTKFETNNTQLFSWGAVTGPIKELLKPNQYITTSGTLTSNNVEPF